MSDAPIKKPVESENKPQGDNLHPALINYKQIVDVKAREEAERKIDEWYQQLDKDIAAVFEKHHITVYAIGFRHPGTQEYMPLHGGQFYDAAKASTAVALFMRRQVMRELKIDDTQN